MKIRTVKERILVAFFIYSTISFLVSVTSFLLFRDMEDIEVTTSKVNFVYVRTLMALNAGQEFMLYEIHREDFFQTGQSRQLEDQRLYLADVLNTATDLKSKEKGAKKLEIELHIDTLEQLLVNYSHNINLLFDKTRQLGFDSYGFAGEMKKNLAGLEEEPKLDRITLMQLKQYEIYLVSNDSSFRGRIDSNIAALRSQIITQNDLSSDRRSELIRYLRGYETAFLSLVRTDYEIGSRTQGGLNYKLKNDIREINRVVKAINNTAIDVKNSIMTRIQTVLVIIVTASVILTLFLSISFKFVLEEH